MASQADLFANTLPAPVREDPLHERVERAWRVIHERWPGIAGIRGLDDGRKRAIIARGKDAVKLGAPSPEDGWKEVFKHISRSTFLRGLADPGRGRDRPFRLSLDFVLRPTRFRAILEGVYDDSSDSLPTYCEHSGERISPSRASADEAERRIRDRFNQQRQDRH